jgi:alpha-L-fucosidase
MLHERLDFIEVECTMITRRRFNLALPFAAAAAGARSAPNTYGPVPLPRQLRWHELEFYGFLHFTVNTFTGKEWGYGDEDPSIFDPSAFDADRIVESLAASGMKGVILTAKHHDGFCLWPTKTTDHSVRNSRWRNGKGDVVQDLSHAARRAGLKFGVYLSPWDRNNAQYGRPEYIDIYRRQLRELLTNYGPIFEVWHDGANGGDGYYGGARERRQIDRRTYYDWPKTWDLVRSLQPDACIFSDIGPDIRWVGNEKGIAGETCWATFDPVGEDGGVAAPGFVRTKDSGTGTRHGKRWLPAECDVSIRPGWFWHERENDKVKTPETLLDLYFKSVGRGASFLLNVPPDRRGLIHDNDAAALRAFGKALNATFSKAVAARAKKDGEASREIVLELPSPTPFDIVRIREAIRYGQRVEAVAVDAWTDSSWREIGSATSIGSCRLIRLSAPVTASKVRLRVVQSPVEPLISEFALFRSASA